MSRFIDKLKQVSQAESQPMGFKKEKVFAKPRLLLVAKLSRIDIDNPVAGHLTGADAVLLTIKQGSEIKAFEKAIGLIKNIPWGIWFESTSHGGMKQVMEAGCDFIAFPPEMPLEAIDDGELGKVLLVEASLEASLLRTIDELPVDAVIIAGEQVAGKTLSWRHLMLFRRLADILNKPLIAFVPSTITGDGLQAIWEEGISGVIVEAIDDELSKLSRVIDGLTPPSKRRRTRIRAIVPKFEEEAAPVADEEDEDY